MAKKKRSKDLSASSEQQDQPPPASPPSPGPFPPATDLHNLRSDFKVWQDTWQVFLNNWRGHLSWLVEDQPSYWLPEIVVEVLVRRTPASGPGERERSPIITQNEADLERAFRNTCQEFSTSVIGVWHGEPVRYDPLLPPEPPMVTAESIRKNGWEGVVIIAKAVAEAEEEWKEVDNRRHQQVAYAGWLTFNPQYRFDRDALLDQWNLLTNKPPFPLLARTGDQQPDHVLPGTVDSRQRLPDNAAAFLDRATKILRKWQLSSLATWDLPVPQGPIGPVPLDMARNILGPDHIGTFVPSYYDIPSTQNIRQEVRDLQQSVGEAAGIDAEFPLTDLRARAGHASAYENAFRLWIIERAVAQRFGERRGLNPRLLEALATHLNCSVDRVQQLQKIYKPFLAGSGRD